MWASFQRYTGYLNFIKDPIYKSRFNSHFSSCTTIELYKILTSPFLMEMFLALLPMVYIYFSLFVLLECVLMLMTSTTENYF